MGVTDEQPEQKRPFTLVALVAFVPVYLVQVGLLYSGAVFHVHHIVITFPGFPCRSVIILIAGLN